MTSQPNQNTTSAGNTASPHDRGIVRNVQARAADGTLELAIQREAEYQNEYQDLVHYLDIQMKTKPSNSSNWREWVVSTRDAMPMAGLIDGTGIIQVVQLAIKFISQRVRSDTYNGIYLGTVGDHLEETDPSWVKIKHNSLDWTKRKVVTDLQPTSDITQFFDDDDNRFKLFTAPGATRGAEVKEFQADTIH